ncbi:family 16 glycoside hydrolase [Sphingobacterium thalpophilum]|uniref:family 16 glycoside hydrolase n=1 Tax=Sphingobacterium thalpophilum TaxID=259 RepID=UPI003DA2D12D
MKKIFNSLAVLLLISGASYAQQPQNRTTATKIADVLAQQPAEEKEKFLLAMHELEGFTSDDIVAFLKGLKAPGSNNAPIEFAANSYSFYVNQPGKEQQKRVFVEGLAKALSQLSEPTNQVFALRLLRQCADNTAIPAVANCLTNDVLADAAARTLVSIHTNESIAALEKALAASTTEKTAIALVTALGDLKVANAETAILNLTQKYSSDAFQRTALIALSKIGGTASAPLFQNKLNDAAYSYDKFDAVGLGIDYAQSLIDNKHEQDAVKFLNKFFQESQKAKSINGQFASLKLLAAIDPNKQKKNLLSAVKSDNGAYRNLALQLLGKYGNGGDAKSLLSLASKASPDVQESVLNYLAHNGSAASLNQIQALVAKTTSPATKLAGLNAIHTLSQGKETNTLIQALDTDQEFNSSVKALILSSKDANAISEVNNALATVDDNKKIQLLDILSKRSNNASSKAVLAIKTTNPAVEEAIYKAVPNVAQESDLEELFNRLNSTNDAKAAGLLQKAIVNVIQSSNNAKSLTGKLAANISKSAAPGAGKYFPIFAGLGDDQSLQAVKNYVSSSNPDLRSAAIVSLANWSTANALPELVSLSRTETDANLFNTVYRGLIKSISSSANTPDQKTLLLRDAFSVAKTTEQKKAALTALQPTGTYQAFIFAANNMNDPQLGEAAANTAMNIAMDNKHYGSKVREVLEQVIGKLSGSESGYLKEAVVRYLSEMPAKEGYVPLFNGKDLTGWKGLVADPIKRSKMNAKTLAAEQAKADEIMRKGWSVSNGEIVFNGKGDNLATVKQYGDFEMLVDWKLENYGGVEGDAGIYLRGTPQVQIWDIANTRVGAQVGSGGLYNNQKNESKPLKVADNATGEWNTFKIKMLGDKVSVWLNGQLVTDNVPLENYWDRNQSIFPTEQIELQAHGSVVYYRDLYIKEFPRKQIFKLSEQERKDGFEVLFDGTNLDKWTENKAYVVNDEGYIWVYPNAKFGGNLYTKEEYADFIYRFDFKLTPGANNGVGIRAPLEGDAAYEAMEIQVLDDGADVYKDLKPYQYHGSIYGVVTAKKGHLKPLGEWNSEEIYVKGNRVKVTLNGTVIVDADIAEASKNGTLDGKKHPGLKRTSGHIGFLGHGTEVFFKDIRVKRLK